ncbi:hypothetical protein GIB67_039774, partial [Kingdonia uniflora]
SLVSWFKANSLLKIVAVISSTWLLASSSFRESFTLSSNRSSYWKIKASYSSAYSALYKRVCSSLSLAMSNSFCITVNRDSQHQYLIGKQIDKSILTNLQYRHLQARNSHISLAYRPRNKFWSQDRVYIQKHSELE